MKLMDRFKKIPIPPGVTVGNVVSLQITNDPTLPSGFNNWYVGYGHKINKDTTTMVGEICLCQIKNGPVVLRQLRHGRTHGKYDLESITGGLRLEDREIEWCAKILFMQPA